MESRDLSRLTGPAMIRGAFYIHKLLKLMKDMNVKAQEYLDELVDPAGMKRLMGLLLQQQGQSASTNDLIAKEIGLKDPELKAVTEVVSKMNEERGTKMREMFTAGGGGGGGGGGGPDPEMMKKITDLTAELKKKTDTAIDEKLTADQKKAIETLKGEKFTFPEGGGFGGFGGRGGAGGGRGGAGGGGGGGRTRPGSDN